MAKYCIKCASEIPLKRTEILPNVKTCVNCSTTGTYRSITQQYGEGDHTYNDIVILTEEQYKKVEQFNKNYNANISVEHFPDDDEIPTSGKVNIDNIEGDIV
jgi:hypothetical protein